MTSQHASLERRARKNRSGFTLVEIMIVVFIIGLILNIAAPAFLRARDVAWQNTCCANLHNISLAKEQFANDTNAAGTVIPTWDDLSPYIETTVTPLCPATGAVYNFNDIDTLPTCSYGGPVGLPHVINF